MPTIPWFFRSYFRLGILSVLRLCGRRQKIIELIGLRCILEQIRYQPGAHRTVGANTVFGKRLSNVPRSKFHHQQVQFPEDSRIFAPTIENSIPEWRQHQGLCDN